MTLTTRGATEAAASWVVVASLIFFSAAPAVAAEARAWLPAPVVEGLAEQLAGRLLPFVPAGDDAGRRLRAAGELVEAMAETVDAWGARGVLARAPAFASFELPPAGEPHLEAMRHWSICNLLMLRQLEHPDFAADVNARFTATLGLSAVTIAILRLREPFVAAGGSDAEIEAALTAAELEPFVQALQSQAELRTDAEARCGPLVLDLLAAPLARMEGRAAPPAAGDLPVD